MAKSKTRRPFVRPSRALRNTNRTSRALQFEALEPRKLLTTLYAFPDYTSGQTDFFAGYVAMPAWFGFDEEVDLDASGVEERSVIVRIQILDTGAATGPSPSVTINDLDGNPLIPWVGQFDRETGEYESAEVEVSVREAAIDEDEPDGFWGTGDDEVFSGFGLDVGYVPGWDWSDPTNDASPFVFYHPVFNPRGFRQFWGAANLEFDPDEGWDTEAELDPNDYIVIPETGTHYLVGSGAYVGHNFRLPEDFGPDQYTDDRVLGTSDDAEARAGTNPDPFEEPENQFWHRIDRVRHGFDADEFIIGADDGIADFNNGIGQIILSNVRSTTRIIFSVFEDVEAMLDGEPIADPFQLPDFGAVGIGPMLDGEIWQSIGMGRIIVGNPTNADWTVVDPLDNLDLFLPIGWQSYSFESSAGFPDRLREGIFFEDPSANETMGRIFIDGALFGVSRFPGALEMLHVGHLGGDVIVDGEVDGIIVAGDAGYWRVTEEDDGNARAGSAYTNSFINVGRTLGSFIVGGTVATEVNVEGDLDPGSRIDKPFLREGSIVLEYESTVPLAESLDDVKPSWAVGSVPFFPLEPGEEGVSYIHNDTIGMAQYVGRVTNRVEVRGYLGPAEQFDKHSETDNFDDADWFAVAVDGQQKVKISLDAPAYLSVRDERGRILVSRGMAGFSGDISFTPNEAGLIYIVVGGDPSEERRGIGNYALTIRGIEPVTFGEVNGFNRFIYQAGGLGASTGISTTRGSIGAVRSGQEREEFINLSGAIAVISINSAGSVWNVTAGSSIGGGYGEDENQFIGGLVTIEAVDHIGQILAGFGAGEDEGVFLGGSIINASINAVRGNIGRVWAESDNGLAGDIGGLGTVDGVDGALSALFGTTTVTASRGSIGVIHASNRIYGWQASINSGAKFEVGRNGVIDLLEAGVDLADEEVESNRDLALAPLSYGFIDDEPGVFVSPGSNVRFFRAPHVFSNGEEAAQIELFANQTLTLVDDSGAEFSIKISGGAGFGLQSVGKVVTAPIQNSLGISLAQLIVDLAPGADLIITNNSGRVEIGDVIVMGSQFNSGQRILFNGSGDTDVYLLRAIGEFDLIENSTSGDMIAIDAHSVSTVRVAGNLGQTQTTKYGPKLLGPLYGVAAAAPAQPPQEISEEARALALGIPTADLGWIAGGEIQINPEGFFGDDELNIIGSVVDPYLNGMIVRDTRQVAPVERVDVGGALGDLIVQSTIERVEVNSDGTTPFGGFHGVVGSVYAQGDIEFIDVGDGLVARQPGPWLNAGIMAQGAIHHVLVDGAGHAIEGFISAAGAPIFPPAFQDFVFFIDRIEAKNGASIDGAYITTDPVDDFWWGEGRSASPGGSINRIDVSGGGVLRDTTIRATNIDRIDVKGGAWDANQVFVTQNIGRVTADEFTATRETIRVPLASTAELAALNVSIIQASGSIDRIETRGGNGNILNLVVDIQGNLGRIRANDMEDLVLQVDNTIERVDAKGQLTRSTLTAGAIDQLKVNDDIARTTINVAGPISRLQSKQGRMYLIDVNVTGPSGGIDRLQAQESISGEISVTGPIDRIKSKSGDITALVQTTGDRGDIGQIDARNVFITLDASGNVGKIKASDTIGVGEILRIRGDLDQVDVKNGVFDSRLVVEGALNKKFQAGSMTAGSDIEVSRSIKKIDIGGGLEDVEIVSHSEGIDKLDVDGDVDSDSLIAAYDGGMNKIRINGGDVAGTIFSDEEVSRLQIRSSNGVGGNVSGVIEGETTLSKVDIDGNLTGGQVKALLEVSKLDIDGNVTGGSIIAAGRLLDRISIGGSLTSSFVIAGLDSLGADNALGGTLLNADSFSSGDIVRLDVGGDATGAYVVAGVRAGADGSYASGSINANTDLPPGLSVIDRVDVRGNASGGTRIIADTAINSVRVNGEDVSEGGGSAALIIVNPNLPDLSAYQAFDRTSSLTVMEADGDQVTFTLNGSGTGYVLRDGSNNVLDVLYVGTDTGTNATIEVTGGSGDGEVNLANAATIRTFDDASLSTLNMIEVPVQGAASINIDGEIKNLSTGRINTSGTIVVGGPANNLTFGRVFTGSFNVANANSVAMNGGFSGTWTGEVLNNFVVNGAMTDATLYARDEINSIRITGALGGRMDGSNIATNGSIHSLSAAMAQESIVSAGDVLENVRFDGNVIESEFLAGFALGSDADFGGTGTAADELTDGIVTNFFVGGDFVQSSIAAGVTRGSERFFGDDDDLGDVGYSEVSNVTIRGVARGSNTFSQSYAITASGEVSNVTARGNEFVQNGNLVVNEFVTSPLPVVVTEIETRLESLTFLVDIYFNHDLDNVSVTGGDPLDPTFESAISVINDEGGVDPTELDYSVEYDEEERRATITFERAFTQDHPGIYRVIIDAERLQSTAGVGLDGNGDGVVGDDFESRILLGDVGDRTEQVEWDSDGDGDEDTTLFAATNLDLLLTDPVTGDRVNRVIQLAGRVGDHPQRDPLYFPAKMDLDLFSIELNPGETLLVDMNRASLDSGLVGEMFLWQFDELNMVWVPVIAEDLLNIGYTWNGDEAEQFYLGVGGTDLDASPPLPTSVQQFLIDIRAAGFSQILTGNVLTPDMVWNDIGNYSLQVQVFDDGDTGFDGRGTDTAVPDGVKTTFYGQIGNAENGNPTEKFVDADVYDLTFEGGAVVLPEGTTVTITLRVDELGSTLGAFAEFGLFKLTGGGVDSGELVAAPGYAGLYDSARNLTISVEIPEDGQYAVYVQGSTQTDYELDVTIDRSTAGPITLPTHQNVLLETNGGFAEWLGRFGTDLAEFDLTNLGFEGQEAAVISEVLDKVEAKFEEAQVNVDVELNPSNFGRENFSTVFLATDFADDVESPLVNDIQDVGAAEKFDPLNQDPNDEAVVFIEDFGFFDPGQRDLLIDALANAVTRQIGHLLGLRTVTSGSVMTEGVSGGAQEFADVPLPLEGITNNAAAFLNQLDLDITGRNGAWVLGQQNDEDMLQYVLASGA